MKKYFLILLFILGGALGGAGFFVAFNQDETSQEKQNWNYADITTSLEGFEPEALLKYNIFSSLGDSVTGYVTVDKSGRADISPHKGVNLQNSNLTYEIEEYGTKEDPFRVVLQFNSKTQKLSVLGEGLDKFSDVSFTNNTKILKTKTDWAGRLDFSQALDLQDLGTEEGVKLAFFDNGFGRDVYNPASRIIKVVMPGCGTYTTMVNACVSEQMGYFCSNPSINDCMANKALTTSGLNGAYDPSASPEEVALPFMDISECSKETYALNTSGKGNNIVGEVMSACGGTSPAFNACVNNRSTTCTPDTRCLTTQTEFCPCTDPASPVLPRDPMCITHEIPAIAINTNVQNYCLSNTPISTCVQNGIRNYCENLNSYCDPVKKAATNANEAALLSSGYVESLRQMTEQLSALMMQQMQILGTFFDAKMQLQTQREIQKLSARAHKDYHPSELMCEFGSFVKSVPRAEEKAWFEKQAINTALVDFYRGAEHMSSSEGYSSDVYSRIIQFRTVYCDPGDNNNGLGYLCDHDQDGNPATGPTGATNPERMNKDINYARTAGVPLTLKIDFSDDVLTPDEEDVLALAKHLYWPVVLESAPHKELSLRYSDYMDARQLFAINSVAHNSFAHIAAIKSQAPDNLGAQSGWNFMKAMMKGFGLADADIHKLLGDYPSYYAQMEVLTKKIYQRPEFFTNLHDKPANIDRISVALDAIKLMQIRDHYDASLRREMLNSLLVEDALSGYADDVNTNIRDTWVND